MTDYSRYGSRNCGEFINKLSDQFDIPHHVVHAIASVLDPTDDFKSFVKELEHARLIYLAIRPAISD